MKIYLQSYNNFAQNIAGGVKTKVFNHKESLIYSAEIFVKPSSKELFDDYLGVTTRNDVILESYRLLVDNIFVIRDIALKQVSYESRN